MTEMLVESTPTVRDLRRSRRPVEPLPIDAGPIGPSEIEPEPVAAEPLAGDIKMPPTDVAPTAQEQEEERPDFVSLFPGEEEAAQFLGTIWQDILRLWCQNDRIVAVLTDPANVERVQALMEAIEAPAGDPRKQAVVHGEKQGI